MPFRYSKTHDAMMNHRFRASLIAGCLAAALASLHAPAARADDRPDEKASLEQLRETVSALLDSLVEQGVLTRAKADELLRNAQARAAATAQAQPATPAAPPVPANVVRVPYVPETVRNEMRDQIKEEVIAMAKAERWGDPGALPSWLDRIQFEGDLRLRYQADKPSESNASPYEYANAAYDNGLTRAASFTTLGANGLPTANTTETRERLRLRARFGLLARVNEHWGVGVRVGTGAAGSGAVSTSQTLGQNGSTYATVIDRAYVRYEPGEWMSASAGRLPNPFFSTNLVWNDDLNFEGVAATLRWPQARQFAPFGTLGYFPLRESNPPLATERSLAGAQVGFDARFAGDFSWRLGLAYYRYANLQARLEADYAEQDSVGYGRYEYPASMRQRGNTLVRTNASTDTSATSLWGLASKFELQNLTTALDWEAFDPVHVVLSADYVRNTGFDRAEILARTGARLTDGSDRGHQLRLTVGQPTVRASSDWQVALGYRKLGSDAVLDAFTDTDFGLGGTNNKGYFLTATLGLEYNTSVTLRYLAARSLDTPTLRRDASTGALARDDYKVDVFQIDLNTRF